MAITPRAAGAWAASNATTQTVTLPTHATGDMLILIAACKPFSADPTVATTGWTRLYSYADGSVANGDGVGSVRQAVFWKIATSAAETSPVVTWNTTSAPGIAVAQSYEKGASETWAIPNYVNGNTNNATSISVAMSTNLGIATGDLGIVIHTTRDNSALTVPTWTATGASLATVVEFPGTAIASGTSNDMAGDTAYRIVSSGIATAAPTLTGTQAAAETGVTSFVLLRVMSGNFPAAVMPMSPGGYWRLGEPSGTVAANMAASFPGAYVDTPTLAVAGALSGDTDTAITITAGTERVNVSTFDISTAAITFVVWIQGAFSATDSAPIGQWDGNGAVMYYDVGLSSGSFKLFINANSVEWTGANATLVSSGYHMVAATWDDSDDQARIYADGVLVAGPTSLTGPIVVAATDFMMGSYGNGAHLNFDGSIDEGLYFPTRLSADQIFTLYQAGAGRRTPRFAPYQQLLPR